MLTWIVLLVLVCLAFWAAMYIFPYALMGAFLLWPIILVGIIMDPGSTGEWGAFWFWGTFWNTFYFIALWAMGRIDS